MTADPISTIVAGAVSIAALAILTPAMLEAWCAWLESQRPRR